MEIVRRLENINNVSSSVLTLGSYDGIHVGHKEIIKTVEVILCPLISSKSSCNKYLP